MHKRVNTTQTAKYKKHSDLIPWKFVEMSNFFEFLFILKFVTKKLHAQCACRLENLLAQRKKCMHLCKSACVKSSTESREGLSDNAHIIYKEKMPKKQTLYLIAILDPNIVETWNWYRYQKFERKVTI